MESLHNDTILQRNPAVSARRTDDNQIILYNPDTGREKTLNLTGSKIWQDCDGTKGAAELAAMLTADFDASSAGDVEKDICTFAAILVSEGYIIALDKCLAHPDPAEYCPSFRDAPKQMDISLTGKCNLKCQYCFYAHEMAGRDDLPTNEWITFFQELKSLGTRSLVLSGGEVFTRRDLWDLIDVIIDARMRFCLLSNGTMITEQTLEDLNKHNRRRRLDSIQISIDGSCAEIHDKSRGAGSFAPAIRALRLLKEAGIPVASRMTINRHNVNDIENTAALLLEEIGLPAFGTNDAMPMGAGCNNQASITLTPQQQLQAMRTLEALEKKYNHRINATAGPQSKIKCYRDMEYARLTGKKATRWNMGCLSACGCVFNKLSINHDGIITPCNILPTTELGRINQDRISDIWLNHTSLKALRERREISMHNAPGCENCEWAGFCNGSCPGLACEMTGDFNLANPHDCYRNFLNQITEEDRYNMFIKPIESGTS